MAHIQLKHVCKRYENGFEAVKDFNLEIQDNEFIIFVFSFVYDTSGNKWSKISITAKWTMTEAKEKVKELKDMEQEFPER